MSFSERFSQLLAEHPSNQSEIAAALDLSEGAIVNYKRGRVPKADELYRIARFFGVTMEYLLTGQAGEQDSSFVMKEEMHPYKSRVVARVAERLDDIIEELEKMRRDLDGPEKKN